MTRAEKLMHFILKNSMIDRRLKDDKRIFLFYSDRMLHDEVNFGVEQLKILKKIQNVFILISETFRVCPEIL